jgi:phospholipid transport system substrate-binding protein
MVGAIVIRAPIVVVGQAIPAAAASVKRWRQLSLGQPIRRALAGVAIMAVLGFAVAGAKAAPASDPAALVDNLVSQALAMLQNNPVVDAQREQEFRALLEANFDIPRISRFVLGRYWNSASEEERQTFGQLFERWIVRIYAGRFKEYSGETVKVAGARAESETSSIVSTEIVQGTGAPPVKVDWRVRQEKGDFKIVDVNVEGVSLALTQREEFAAVVGRNGGTVGGLNKALEDKLTAGEVTARQGN